MHILHNPDISISTTIAISNGIITHHGADCDFRVTNSQRIYLWISPRLLLMFLLLFLLSLLLLLLFLLLAMSLLLR
jgi:hypothetical protein